jgi:hypothetical protein
VFRASGFGFMARPCTLWLPSRPHHASRRGSSCSNGRCGLNHFLQPDIRHRMCRPRKWAGASLNLIHLGGRVEMRQHRHARVEGFPRSLVVASTPGHKSNFISLRHLRVKLIITRETRQKSIPRVVNSCGIIRICTRIRYVNTLCAKGYV